MLHKLKHRCQTAWHMAQHYYRFRTRKAVPGSGVYGCLATDPVEMFQNHDHSICLRRRDDPKYVEAILRRRGSN